MMFDESDVLASMEKAVAAKGANYRYRSDGGNQQCRYAGETGPGCLVGWVLHDLTPELYKRVAEQEANCGGSFSAMAFAPTGVSWALYGMEPRFTAAAVDALAAAQSRQDSDVPWGEAVEYARHNHRKIMAASEKYEYVGAEFAEMGKIAKTSAGQLNQFTTTYISSNATIDYKYTNYTGVSYAGVSTYYDEMPATFHPSTASLTIKAGAYITPATFEKQLVASAS